MHDLRDFQDSHDAFSGHHPSFWQKFWRITSHAMGTKRTWHKFWFSLPPASEGWRRSCFHGCVSVHTWEGVPHLHPIILPLVSCSLLGEVAQSQAGVPQSQAGGVLQFQVGVVPQSQIGITPFPGMWCPSPLRTEQQSEYLLPDRRHASCIQAGGLFWLQYFYSSHRILT